MKKTLSLVFFILGFISTGVLAESWQALFANTYPDGTLPPRKHKAVDYFPHQIAVSDLICTGTVLSTNDGRSAEFAVDEIIWGYVASSNITLRPVESIFGSDLAYLHEGRYLILAFTNNWWGSERQGYFCEKTIHYLHDYITPTSRPPDHAVFNDYRLFSRYGSAISFDDIIIGGTNYWEGTRDFITNMLVIAKIHQDERRAYEWFYSLYFETNAIPVKSRLPPIVWLGIRAYKLWRYEGRNLPPPDKLPPRGQVHEPPYEDFVPPNCIE